MARIQPIGPNVRGYVAGMLDLKGNAYTSREKQLTVYLNGVRAEAIQTDLLKWIGGGSITENSSDGDRRGCKIHCDLPHFHYTRTSVKYTVTGLRALCVLHTLEPSLFTWGQKFATPYHNAIQRIEEVSTTKDGMKILDDMTKRGWEVP